MIKKAVILVLLLGLGAWAYWAWQRQQATPPRRYVSGTVETDEIHVASRHGGRVATLHAREGDALVAGQLIAELAATELRPQRDQAAAALADLEAGARPEELAAARADLDALTAELDFARTEEKRAQGLFAQNIAAETERDRAVTRRQALEKNVAAARSRLDLLLAGARPGRVVQARAALAEIDARLAELRVTAPTNCVLEVLSVRVGDVLAPNRELATLLLPQHLWVRVFVPQPWLGRWKLGDPMTVTVDAFPGQTFRGVIEQMNRAAEFTPRNVQTTEERVQQVFGVKVRLDDESGRLKAGMSVDVVFPDVTK